MATATRTTNRRALLGAIGMAPVAVLVAAAPAEGVVKASPERTAWDRAYAKMQAAKAAAEAHEPAFNAAVAGFNRDVPTGDDINLRPLSPLITPAWRQAILHTEDLDKVHADFIAQKGQTWFGPDPDATIARHKETIERVRQFRADIQAAKDRHNYDAIVERDDDLSQAAYDATWEVIHTPAPDLAALQWKLEYLFGDVSEEEYSPSWCGAAITDVMADARRLMAEAA